MFGNKHTNDNFEDLRRQEDYERQKQEQFARGFGYLLSKILTAGQIWFYSTILISLVINTIFNTDALGVFIGMFLSKIFVYLYRIIIARHYGSEVYGLFALSIMVIGWFRLVSGLGLKQGLLRYISLFRGKKEMISIFKKI